MKPINPDEKRVAGVLNDLLALEYPGLCARLATPEEDCGFRKADVVASYGGKVLYLQVSKTPKSNRETEKLLNRGTYPVHTHKHADLPLSDNELARQIASYL